jgi:hypothetical protein
MITPAALLDYNHGGKSNWRPVLRRIWTLIQSVALTELLGSEEVRGPATVLDRERVEEVKFDAAAAYRSAAEYRRGSRSLSPVFN